MKTKEIAAYVRNNVEFFEERLQLALNKMDRMRCPLRMADEVLFNDIADAVEEWCDENEVSLDFFDDSEEIAEEILMTEI